MTAPAVDTRPFAPYEWMLALRYLRARRKEGFISVIAIFSFLGILLGVATLIIVMAVMDGFHQELAKKILGLDGHVIVDRIDRIDIPDYDDLAEKLKAVPTVKHAVPLIDGPVLVSTPASAVPGKVRGVTEQGLEALPLVSDHIKFGSIKGFDSQDGIAIGIGFQRYLRVGVGDTVTLTSPRGAHTPFGVVPRSKSYRVTAIFDMGMSEFDRTMIFMPLAEAQHFFDKGSSVDVVDVVVDDPEKVEASVKAIEDSGIPLLRTVTWKERNGGFFTVLEVERNTMFVVLLIIMLVAAFNIISGLVMLVKDKGREIGILRTMGATQGAIMRVFLITGGSIGVFGTFAGCLFGVLFCWRIENIRQLVAWITRTNIFNPDFYYLTKMPADLNWGTITVVTLIALVLSVLATLYPSWRASRLDPVEALRYE